MYIFNLIPMWNRFHKRRHRGREDGERCDGVLYFWEHELVLTWVEQ